MPHNPIQLIVETTTVHPACGCTIYNLAAVFKPLGFSVYAQGASHEDAESELRMTLAHLGDACTEYLENTRQKPVSSTEEK